MGKQSTVPQSQKWSLACAFQPDGSVLQRCACDFLFQARTNEIVNFCGILRLQCLTFHSMVSAGDVKGAVKTHEGVMAWEGEG